ncbi:MAG: MFS transporter [Pseudomonadota bacterium]|nr:MFS transporter [Pseudomonadota bacterium]
MEISPKTSMLQRLMLESPPLRFFSEKPSWHWIIVATVCIGAFLGQLDASIVSLVLPTLQDTFHVPFSQVQWVAILYLLVLTSLITPLGRIADKFGRKSLYVNGFIVFIVGSGLCGLAPNLDILIIARALQGIGAAMLQANSVAIITAASPKKALGRAIGVQATAQALGLAIGPSLGGLLIEILGWRWVFLLNLPIGLAGALLARFTLPQTHHQEGSASLNIPGAIWLTIAIASLLMALSWLHLVIYYLPAFFLSLYLFWRSEKKAEKPLLGPTLLSIKGFKPGITAGLLSYSVLFSGLFAIPILLERVFLIHPAKAGLLLTLIPVCLTLIAQLGGWLTDRTGPKFPTVTGMLISAVGTLVLYLGANHDMPVLVAGLIGLGAGMGLFIPANNASVMGLAPTTHLGLAGGLLNMMRGLGGSLGVALVSLILMLNGSNGMNTVTGRHNTLVGIKMTMVICMVLALIAAFLSFERDSVKSMPVDHHDKADLL